VFQNKTHQSNALADPGAVVVELLDAVVADGAVRRPRRPVQQARVAVLDAHDAHDVPGARQPEARVRGVRHHPLGGRRGGVHRGLRRARVPRHDPGVPAGRREQEREILRECRCSCQQYPDEVQASLSL
jgi:hypothetical protein